MKPLDPLFIAKATALREQGLTYREIGSCLNKNASAICYAINADHRNKNKVRQAQRIRTFPGRAEHAVANAGWQAERFGHAKPTFTSAEAVAKFNAIDGVCPITGRPDSSERLVLDHCHATGIFRGWIAGSCNKILGLAKDNPATLRKLADYLDGQSNTLSA